MATPSLGKFVSVQYFSSPFGTNYSFWTWFSKDLVRKQDCLPGHSYLMPGLANSSQNERRGKALETLCVTMDVAAWRKQCGLSDPTKECWLLGGSSVPRERSPAAARPVWPAQLLSAPAPTHGPNLPERWTELEILPWNGQSKSRTRPLWKTKPCDSPAYKAIHFTVENCISEVCCLQLRRTFLDKIQGWHKPTLSPLECPGKAPWSAGFPGKMLCWCFPACPYEITGWVDVRITGN